MIYMQAYICKPVVAISFLIAKDGRGLKTKWLSIGVNMLIIVHFYIEISFGYTREWRIFLCRMISKMYLVEKQGAEAYVMCYLLCKNGRSRYLSKENQNTDSKKYTLPCSM